jgi:hypothetical protein
MFLLCVHVFVHLLLCLLQCRDSVRVCVFVCVYVFVRGSCLFVCLFVFISLCAYACIQCLRPMPPIQPRTRAPTIDNVDHGIVVGHDDDDDDVDAGRGDDGWWVDGGIL